MENDLIPDSLMSAHGYRTFSGVEALFNRDAKRYAQICVDTSYIAPGYLAERVLPIMRRQKQRFEILDVGCGTGEAGVHYLREGHIVDGVDISEQMLKHAESAGYRSLTQWRVCVDHLTMFRPAGTYDAVISIGAVEFMPFEHAIREMSSVLKSKGMLAFATEITQEQEEALEGILRSEGFDDMYVGKALGYRMIASREIEYVYCIATKGFSL